MDIVPADLKASTDANCHTKKLPAAEWPGKKRIPIFCTRAATRYKRDDRSAAKRRTGGFES